MNTVLRYWKTLLTLGLLCFLCIVQTITYGAFSSLLDISSPPSLLEVGSDYVLLEIPPHEKAASYKVYYSDRPFRGDEKVFVKVDGKNIALISNLQAGIRYYFSAIAVDENGNESESFSPAVSLKLAAEGQAPSLLGISALKEELNVHGQPVITREGYNDVKVVWNAVPEASYYKVYYAKEESINRSYHPFVKAYEGTEVTLSGLDTDIDYRFGIVAVDRAGFESKSVSNEYVANFAPLDEPLSFEEGLDFVLPPMSIILDQYKRVIRWDEVPGAKEYIVWKSRYPFTNSMYHAAHLRMGSTTNTFYNVGSDSEEPVFYLAIQAVDDSGRRGPLSESVKIIFPHTGERKHLNTVYQDIETDGWYASALVSQLQEGILSLNAQKLFKPTENITRAAFSKMLLELRRMPLVNSIPLSLYAFCDVDYEQWYGPYVATMTQYDFTKGYPSSACDRGRDFRPAKNVSRAEALKFLFQAFQIDPTSLARSTGDEFKDVATNDWFYYDVLFASQIDLVSGYIRNGEKFYDPFRTITRAEASQLMYKFITQLNYQYHEDNTLYLYKKYDENYRKGLDVVEKPTLLETNDMIRVRWKPVAKASYYRILITPEDVLDRTTRNLLMVSLPNDALQADEDHVFVSLPRSYFPGSSYRVTLLAFDSEYNESFNFSPVAEISLEPIEGYDALEGILYTPDEEIASQPVPEETVIAPVVIDGDCSYVGYFEDHSLEGYNSFVEHCSREYVTRTMSDCSLLEQRADQLLCLQVHGYKNGSIPYCASLAGGDKEACELGVYLKGDKRMDCSKITIYPEEMCLYYTRTAEALFNKAETGCDALQDDALYQCLKTYVHVYYTPTQCTTYLEANASSIRSGAQRESAIAQSCEAFQAQGNAANEEIQKLEDMSRVNDLTLLASTFIAAKNANGLFPASQGGCLDSTNSARIALVDGGFINNDRFPLDPVTSGNRGLCPDNSGYYYYRSLQLNGTPHGGAMIVASLYTEAERSKRAVFTKEEILSFTDFSQVKSALETRTSGQNPVGAEYYIQIVE